jgi:hypothetical protein
LVCDANDHVKCLPTFLGPVLPLLRPGGDVVLTLKYYGRGPKKGDVAGKLAELLPVRLACCWLGERGRARGERMRVVGVLVSWQF